MWKSAETRIVYDAAVRTQFAYGVAELLLPSGGETLRQAGASGPIRIPWRPKDACS